MCFPSQTNSLSTILLCSAVDDGALSASEPRQTVCQQSCFALQLTMALYLPLTQTCLLSFFHLSLIGAQIQKFLKLPEILLLIPLIQHQPPHATVAERLTPTAQ